MQRVAPSFCVSRIVNSRRTYYYCTWIVDEKVSINVCTKIFLTKRNLPGFCLLVQGWKSEGCFKESKKRAKRLLTKKFAKVKRVDKKNPDIEKIYNKCKAKAEKYGYEIFAIQVRFSYLLYCSNINYYYYKYGSLCFYTN